jgi:hypothetical protein
MAAALMRQDIAQWAAGQDIGLVRGGAATSSGS